MLSLKIPPPPPWPHITEIKSEEGEEETINQSEENNDLSDILLESIWMKQLQKSWDIAPCKTCARFCSKRINIKKQVNREML